MDDQTEEGSIRFHGLTGRGSFPGKVQSEVARAIAGEIQVALTPAESERLAAASAVDPRALDEYLKGRFLWSRRTEESVRRSLAHFQTAVDLAPEVPNFITNVADLGMILQQGFMGKRYPPPAFVNQGTVAECP